MSYDTETINYTQVCQQYDLVTQMERDGVQLIQNGANRYKAACPLGGHSGANKGNLSVYHTQDDGRAKWVYHCFACKRSGDVVSWVRERNGLSHNYEAVEYLQHGAVSPTVVRTYVQPKVNPPLPANKAEAYHTALMRSPQHAQWWQAQGLSVAAMEYFKVGYCPELKSRFYDGDTAQWKDINYGETYTIPVYHDGELVTIRHRIAKPIDPRDKYRPERSGDGSHIFNSDVLSNPLVERGSIFLFAGEKKVMVLHDHFNLRSPSPSIIPMISATAGAGNWYGRYADVWPKLLNNFNKVYICFDPGEEEQAERTAMLFGRRAHIVAFPGKPDDLIIDDPEEGMYIITESIGRAEPLRSTSYWLSVGLGG